EAITVSGFVFDTECGNFCNSSEGRIDYWAAQSAADFEATKFKIGSATLHLGIDESIAEANDITYCCLAPRTWLIRGFYVPDIGSSKGNNDPSSGDATAIVNKATTSTTASDSPDPSALGQSVTFTVNVGHSANLSGNAALPSGTVTVSETTPNGTIQYNGNLTQSTGQATITTSTMTPGTHTLTAKYNGDDNYLESSSSSFTHT